ncbi:MAG: HipA domain-containing protein [Bifidobacteriaceae bacterium]|nr:HipA domain-containing protein [Bifidobacteriaceae bacterium]
MRGPRPRPPSSACSAPAAPRWGAPRPKAAVRDGGRLALAKFPHRADRWDVMAWEATALDLARAAGLSVPGTRLTRVGARSVLLSQRFDRDGGARLGHISALALVPADDAAQADYLDVAQALARLSAHPSGDLAELWRRVAFNIAVHNTDDHLRNLGLLRAAGGCRPPSTSTQTQTPTRRPPGRQPSAGRLAPRTALGRWASSPGSSGCLRGGRGSRRGGWPRR